MSCDVHAFYEKFDKDMAKMKEAIPEALKGFGGLFQAVMKDGAISLKQKELVAIGIAVACQCQPCIYLHTKKCLEAGASREEILEAVSVSIMMQGGPAYTHIPEVLDALEACEK